MYTHQNRHLASVYVIFVTFRHSHIFVHTIENATDLFMPDLHQQRNMTSISEMQLDMPYLYPKCTMTYSYQKTDLAYIQAT